MINWAWGPCRVCKRVVFEPNLGVFIGWLGDLKINVTFSLKNVPYTHSALPPGPIYQLLTTSLAWLGLNSPPKVAWWAELPISVPEYGPFFKSKIEKKFRRFFFPKFFQRTNCFYGSKK